MYFREGLGAKWYETVLDVVGEAGASVAEAYGGKGAGAAVRGLHSGWTSAAFKRPPQRQPQQLVAPPQYADPGYAQQQQPYYPQQQQPYYPQQQQPYPQPGAPGPTGPNWGALVPRGNFQGSATLSGSTVVLLGGLGVGAILLILAMKPKNVPVRPAA